LEKWHLEILDIVASLTASCCAAACGQLYNINQIMPQHQAAAAAAAVEVHFSNYSKPT